jgi:hypothetical protein
MANEDETGAQLGAPTANALARDLSWTIDSNGRDAVCATEEQSDQPALTHENSPSRLMQRTGETATEIRIPPSSRTPATM